MEDKKALLEAALFLAAEPLSTKQLANVLSVGSPGYVATLLEEYAEELAAGHRGIELEELDGKYQLSVKEQYLPDVAHLAPQQDMSHGVLRTLALIAYNAPVEQTKVVEIRGNRTYNHVKELLNRGLIKAEPSGRTKELDVTKDFLEYFGIETVQEFREMVDAQELEDGGGAVVEFDTADDPVETGGNAANTGEDVEPVAGDREA